MYKAFRIPFIFFSICIAFSICACEDSNSVGIQLENETVTVNYTDTITVKVSTVLLDSVVSSGTGTILAGKYTDEAVGTTSASGYFQVNLDTNWSLDDNAVFDSIRLILPYSSYSYGDTTAALSLQIQQLSQEISTRALSPLIGTEESYSYFYSTAGLYNTSQVATYSSLLGNYTFIPRASTDSISIPLTDKIGRDWLQKQKDQHQQFTSAANFLHIFQGIKISAIGNSNSVVGFTASGVKIRLYYREPSGDKTVNSYHDFPLISGSTQFNNIQNEFSQSDLKGIVKGGDPVSSERSNNTGYIQSGTGLMVKLEFPYLSKIKEVANVNLINQALLEIVPLAGTNRYPTEVPDSLSLYTTDISDVPLGLHVQDNSTSAQVAVFQKDEFNMSSRYQFKLTTYITDLLKNGTEGKSVLLGAPAQTYTKTVNRLCIGGPLNASSKVKLKIYFTRLN